MKRGIAELFMLALLAGVSLSAGGAAGTYVSLPPPPARIERSRPPQPGPEYVWVPGYWSPKGPRYEWHEGAWVVPPFPGAVWVAPRYEDHQYYGGYWREADNGAQHKSQKRERNLRASK
jgi:hypothetical protein